MLQVLSHTTSNLDFMSTTGEFVYFSMRSPTPNKIFMGNRFRNEKRLHNNNRHHNLHNEGGSNITNTHDTSHDNHKPHVHQNYINKSNTNKWSKYHLADGILKDYTPQ